MKLRPLILSALVLLAISAAPTRAAVLLSSLTHPTLQTLISLGSDGVTVGPDRFYDFAFTGTAPVGSSSANVAVGPITAGGDGLSFVGKWIAMDGGSVANTITFQVAIDPSTPIGSVNLFSASAILSPSAGTVASTSLSTRSLSNVLLAPALATFADGTATPTNSASSAFSPQSDLMITDSITITSTPSGVADVSNIQNTFVPVPEPSRSAWFFIPAAIVATNILRRRYIESCTRRSIAL
jgi:hypothetical protein